MQCVMFCCLLFNGAHQLGAELDTSNSLVHTTELVDANGGVFTFELFEHDLTDPAGAITMFCRHINRCTLVRGHTHAHMHTCLCSAHSHMCHHACTRTSKCTSMHASL